MNKRTLCTVLSILLYVVAIVCFAVCIAQSEKNTALLVVGLSCTSIALVVNCIINRQNKHD